VTFFCAGHAAAVDSWSVPCCGALLLSPLATRTGAGVGTGRGGNTGGTGP
jgi:hypothetical protein